MSSSFKRYYNELTVDCHLCTNRIGLFHGKSKNNERQIILHAVLILFCFSAESVAVPGFDLRGGGGGLCSGGGGRRK